MSRLPSLGPRGEGWFALQILMFFAIFTACYVPLGAVDALQSVAVGAVGVGLFIGGWALGLAGVLGLGDSFRALPRPKSHATLVQDGIYGIIRNPIYAAVILVAFGAALFRATAVGIALSAVLALLLDLKARREEVWLRERFPEYDAYSARVRRFVPRVY